MLRVTLRLQPEYHHVVITGYDNLVSAGVDQILFDRYGNKPTGDSVFEKELVKMILIDEDVSCVELFEPWEIAVRYVAFDFDHEPSIVAIKTLLEYALRNFAEKSDEEIEITFDGSFEIYDPRNPSPEQLRAMEDELLVEETLDEIRSRENGYGGEPGSHIKAIIADQNN